VGVALELVSERSLGHAKAADRLGDERLELVGTACGGEVEDRAGQGGDPKPLAPAAIDAGQRLRVVDMAVRAGADGSADHAHVSGSGWVGEEGVEICGRLVRENRSLAHRQDRGCLEGERGRCLVVDEKDPAMNAPQDPAPQRPVDRVPGHSERQ
jgi:hypothetical protein